MSPYVCEFCGCEKEHVGPVDGWDDERDWPMTQWVCEGGCEPENFERQGV